jgi:hypothetical protein
MELGGSPAAGRKAKPKGGEKHGKEGEERQRKGQGGGEA